MRILMIGLGSIGQRHLRNIKRTFGDEHEIIAYRTRRLQQTFSDDLKIREGVSLEEEYNLTVYTDLDEALKTKPDVAFITNITAKHIECATKCAKAGCNLFLEKPISDSMDGVLELQKICKEKNLTVWVGYQNRYHLCVQRMKEILETGAIGNLVSVHSDFCERVTTMHTYEDYSTTYMARKDMGGGPVLNLQIHDLDCLQWLFGTPESVYSVCNKNSGINIDVEDSASSVYRFKDKNGRLVPVYAYTDFLQFPPSHKMKVVGEKGRIEIDFLKATLLYVQDGEVKEEKSYDDFVRNQMFIWELSDFFNCIKEKSEPDISFEQGIVSLKMALAAKKSSTERREVLLSEI